MTIKLVAVDLDDTLLDNNLAVSPRTADVIRRAVAGGATVTVATGRMFCSARPYARQLELDVPLITYNGAMIRRSISEETLLHKPLDADTARQVLAFFKDRGLYIQVYLDDKLYVRDFDDNARLYEKLAGVTAIPVGEELYSPAGAPTKLLALAEPAQIGEIGAEVRETFGDKLYVAASKPFYLEMTNPTVNKGVALAYLAGHLGVRQEEVMAVGDSSNDMDMLAYAGLGVAMGNAAPAVKAAANAVTGANDADGVAEAIEKYVLNK